MKKVIISGGGTGGHIYPAIAIANALKAIDPTIQILFVGALGKMEMEKVPRAGYEIIGLPISGIKRELSVDNISFPFKLTRSLLKARSIIKSFQTQYRHWSGRICQRAFVDDCLVNGYSYFDSRTKLVCRHYQ
jgi:UDP-N-acetylglucosamine--N-acetylmuramyl-(pentapeptide) pyrophosphoryl-undecaprenol N-acetylglucosamine transferase